MATEQRVLRIQYDQSSDTMSLHLACGHVFKVEGWVGVTREGPLDVTSRECEECEYAGVSKVGGPMPNLRTRIGKMIETVVREQTDGTVTGYDGVQEENIAAIMDGVDTAITALISDLGTRMAAEAGQWKHGPRSCWAKLSNLTQQALGEKITE